MKYRDFFKEDMLPGGKGDHTQPQTVDPQELEMGIKTEMEHTQDQNMAKEIALDHLTEDPHYYTKLKQSGLADELNKDSTTVTNEPMKNNGIVEPDSKSVQKQTVPGTVFPEVDPKGDGNVCGCMGNTKGIESDSKTDVESPPKDPDPTHHISGGMAGAEANPNILPKNGGAFETGREMMKNIVKTMTPQDIAIDIAEAKKILRKMIKENTTMGPAHAFGSDPVYMALQDQMGAWKVYKQSHHGTWTPVTQAISKQNAITQADVMNKMGNPKEGYGGDPDTDPKYKKNADGTPMRWTLKW